jgi:hypothetical protein
MTFHRALLWLVIAFLAVCLWVDFGPSRAITAVVMGEANDRALSNP